MTAAVFAAASPAVAGLVYKGMGYVSFDSPADFNNTASDNAVIGIQQLGTNDVALTVYDFTPSITSTQIAPDYTRYSSPLSEVQYAIDYIHGLGMNIMLKPMVDVEDGTWRGMIDPTAANVNTWFTNYQSFIDSYAQLAEANVNNGVTLFSVGCELNDMEQYTSNWTSLISNVRSIYSGKLTYSSNWSVNSQNLGGYNKIAWWNELDYIGIDAYFPLSNEQNPPESQLQSSWTSLANSINTWRTGAGLGSESVIFTEVGYQARPGTSESPAGTNTTGQDIPEQADCYQALLSVMSQQPWWDGVFWWAETPDPVPANDNGFSPENKPQTTSVLQNYYGNPVQSGTFVGVWNTSGDGTWSSNANWSIQGVPNAAQSVAVLGQTITAASTVTLDGTRTVGSINFVSTNAYTIASGSGGSLVMNNGSSAAAINVISGSHTITAPVTLESNLAVTFSTPANALVISGSISGTGGVSQSGSGTLTLNGVNTYSGPTSVEGGLLTVGNSAALPRGNALSIAGAVQLASSIGTINLSSLSISPGATLDVTNNGVQINFAANADPAAAIRALLIQGYNAGGAKWTGTGITSSAAEANPSQFAVGYADGGNAIDRANTSVAQGTVQIQYTVAGDVNLSGGVDLSDLVIIASDFGMSGADWAQGDLNYDGNVDLSDLVIVASSFGASLSGADFSESFAAEWQLALAEAHGANVSVPEPCSVLGLAAGGLLLCRRRGLYNA